MYAKKFIVVVMLIGLVLVIAGCLPKNLEIDNVAPQVLNTTPVDGASGVGLTSNIVIDFSESMDRNTIESAFEINPTVNVTNAMWVDNSKVSLTLEEFSPATEYTVTIHTSAQDEAGNGLPSAYTFSFTTEDTGGNGGTEETGSVSGQVTDTENNPVVGALVAISVDMSMETVVATSTTDQNGNYLVENVPVGEAYYAGALDDLDDDQEPDEGEAKGMYGPLGEPESFAVILDNETTNIDITVSLDVEIGGTASIAGQIFDTEGNPVTGALVAVCLDEAMENLYKITYADQNGDYIAENLPADTYYVGALDDQDNDQEPDPGEDKGIYTGGTEQAMAIELAEDEQLTGIDITLYPEEDSGDPGDNVSIMGKVEYMDETPVINAKVMVVEDYAGEFSGANVFAEVVADETGFYSVSGLTAGEYYVLAYDDLNDDGIPDMDEPMGIYGDEFGPLPVTVVDGQTTDYVDIFIGVMEMPEGSFIAGMVEDESQSGGEDPVGLEGASVYLYDSLGTLIKQTVSGPKGEFMFDELTDGDYYLKAEYTEHVSTLTQIYTVNPEKGVFTPIVMLGTDHPLLANQDLETKGFIGGSVMDYDPMADDYTWVSGATVTLSPLSGTVAYFDLDGDQMVINEEATATTESGEGRFTVMNVDSGNYSITASDGTQSFDNVPLVVKNGKFTMVNIEVIEE